MYEHLDDGFTALEHMDDKGRRALYVASTMWERLHRDALARAERAEWLFERIQKWSEDWGLSFDVDKATEAWNNRYRREPPVLVPWYEARIEKRREEMRELSESLESAYEAEERATNWARRERNRAEAAEAECNMLMAEIERLRPIRRRYESGPHGD